MAGSIGFNASIAEAKTGQKGSVEVGFLANPPQGFQNVLLNVTGVRINTKANAASNDEPAVAEQAKAAEAPNSEATKAEAPKFVERPAAVEPATDQPKSDQAKVDQAKPASDKKAEKPRHKRESTEARVIYELHRHGIYW